MEKSNTRLKLLLLALISSLFVLTVIGKTYALLESKVNGQMSVNSGSWLIKINDKLISNELGKEFNLSDIIYDESNSNIEKGYFAPGKSGYFNIILDPTGTDVAIDYQIIIDINEDNFPSNIKVNVENLTDDNEIVRDNNIFSGLISLDDIKNNKLIKLKLNLIWEDNELYNVSDSELGMIEDNKLKVPIRVVLNQHI